MQRKMDKSNHDEDRIDLDPKMQSELNECREIDIPQEALKIWEKYQLKESLRRHSMKVMELSLNIAKRIKDIDIHVVKIGALLHDIGWAVTNDPFKHFIEGAKILRKEGFPENIVQRYTFKT